VTTPTHNTPSLWSDLDAIVEHDVPIGPAMTWYRIGGSADTLVRPRTAEALATLVFRCRESDVPLRVLGSGANLLVADEGVDGVVVHLDQPVFRETSIIHRHRKNRGGATTDTGDGVRAMSGTSMEKLVMNLSKQGMAGLEMMAGIPSSVGGAIRMNAGGKFGSIGQAVTGVGTLDLSGQTRTYTRDTVEFEYRRCSIVDPIVLWAEFRLIPEDPKLVHDRVKDIFVFKKASQPMSEHTAGCVFKNPKAIGSRDPDGPRISAGKLIDDAGLKGYRVGGASISQRHANFICADKGAIASDVLAVMDHAVEVVGCESGYQLEREIVVWKRRGK